MLFILGMILNIKISWFRFWKILSLVIFKLERLSILSLMKLMKSFLSSRVITLSGMRSIKLRNLFWSLGKTLWLVHSIFALIKDKSSFTEQKLSVQGFRLGKVTGWKLWMDFQNFIKFSNAKSCMNIFRQSGNQLWVLKKKTSSIMTSVLISNKSSLSATTMTMS